MGRTGLRGDMRANDVAGARVVTFIIIACALVVTVLS